ncbi:hypothetical protein GS532_10455 [Rhodococcus hoagii]|nr:hypothetical protein [Prescottella equi]
MARPVGSSELRASTTPLDAGPLSPAQRRLWFQHLLDPASDVYNLAFTLRFSGDLVIGALEEAVRDVLRRHRVLRTTYTTGPDGPLQRVGDGPAVDLTPVAVPRGGLGRFRALPRPEALRPRSICAPAISAVSHCGHRARPGDCRPSHRGRRMVPRSVVDRPRGGLPRARRGAVPAVVTATARLSRPRAVAEHTRRREPRRLGGDSRRRPHRIVAAAGPGPIGDGEPRGRRGSRRASR